MSFGAAKWRSWAGELRARYARGARRVSPATMTLALERPPAATLLQPVCVRVSFASRHAHYAPTLSFPGVPARELVRETHTDSRHTVRERPATPPSAPAPMTLAAVREEITRLSRFAEIVTERVTTRHAPSTATLIQPILESHSRLLLSAPAAGDATRRIVERARRAEVPPPPTPRTLVTPPAPARTPDEHRANDTRQLSAPRPTPAPFAQPEQTLPLDSIAQYVMQQMDRKLIAHRERMGRI
ncbi:MAG: hypothetical protein SFV54_18095 [Bryobacteraceae bacterium]|nr:hypothetical protein [Bryobacteraceae bacterium]